VVIMGTLNLQSFGGSMKHVTFFFGKRRIRRVVRKLEPRYVVVWFLGYRDFVVRKGSIIFID